MHIDLGHLESDHPIVASHENILMVDFIQTHPLRKTEARIAIETCRLAYKLHSQLEFCYPSETSVQ